MKTPTMKELRSAYNDARADFAIAKMLGITDQQRTERIKAVAVWRWIQARKNKQPSP